MSTLGRPPPRRITRLLIANRGEIATRIVAAARELGIYTVTIYSSSDDSHTFNSSHKVQLSSPASYSDVSELIRIAKEQNVDAVHPGYGFLSENAEFSRRLWEDGGVQVVGPGWDILERTGDKLAAKALAKEVDVPVLEATENPVGLEDAKAFMDIVGGRPVMLKAVDGGGGRGIRLVRNPHELPRLARLAMAESPSKQVFVETAAVNGFRHIEVQIMGDGTGAVCHLWERECSIQRRYQKIIEIAPSTVSDRRLISSIIGAALRMAQRIRYFSLGTFEFLANPKTEEFFFLEINPRLQVEHTITEAITGVDIVQAQLRIAQGEFIHDLEIGSLDRLPMADALPPRKYAIQMRLTAENVDSGWSLSVGKIAGFHFPTGNGVRVDTSLVGGRPAVVTSDFDSLIAKIIVSAGSWDAVVRKARRALEDTHVSGVKTNIDVLRAIVANPVFEAGGCDTEWLEAEMPALLESRRQLAPSVDSSGFLNNTDPASSGSGGQLGGISSSTVLFRKGDAWQIDLVPQSSSSEADGSSTTTRHLKLDRVLRNEFPSLLSAEISYSSPDHPDPEHYKLSLTSTQASSSSVLAGTRHRKGSPSDPRHVIVPFPGRLIEVLVDEGQEVRQGDVVAVVQQMKMELDIRSPANGRIVWLTEAEDGDDVAEGMLVAELELSTGKGERPKL
ncbi:3-methylcrotonyl-carboxylase subunit alpha [Seiridium cupressi]